MNRRQKREMEKRLGITKHKQKMGLADRMKSIQSNIKDGRKKEQEMKESIKRKQNESKEKQMESDIASLATTIAVRDGINWFDAMEQAKREVMELYTKSEEVGA